MFGIGEKWASKETNIESRRTQPSWKRPPGKFQKIFKHHPEGFDVKCSVLEPEPLTVVVNGTRRPPPNGGGIHAECSKAKQVLQPTNHTFFKGSQVKTLYREPRDLYKTITGY